MKKMVKTIYAFLFIALTSMLICSPDTYALRPPLPFSKTALEISEKAVIKEKIERGIAILKGYENILNKKGVKFLKDLEGCLEDFDDARAEKLIKKIPSVKDPHLELFIDIILPEAIFMDRGAVVVQFNKGCYNRCSFCQMGAETDYKYMPYPMAVKLINALAKRKFKSKKGEPLDLRIRCYEENDPLHYRDNVIGADFADIYLQMSRKIPEVTISTTGWNIQDKIAQKAARKLSLLLRKKDKIYLSYHFFFDPLIDAVNANEIETIKRLRQEMEDRFKNIIATLGDENVIVSIRRLNYYEKGSRDFPAELIQCEKLQYEALEKIKKEYPNAEYEDDEDSALSWKFRRGKETMERLGFKVHGMPVKTIYGSGIGKMYSVFRPWGITEIKVDFSFKISDYIDSPRDEDLLLLLRYIKNRLNIYYGRPREPHDRRITATSAFIRFIDRMMPNRYPELCNAIINTDFDNIEAENLQCIYNLIKDIKFPYIGLEAQPGEYYVDLARAMINGKGQYSLKIDRYAALETKTPLSLNPLLNTKTDTPELGDILENCAEDFYGTGAFLANELSKRSRASSVSNDCI